MEQWRNECEDKRDEMKITFKGIKEPLLGRQNIIKIDNAIKQEALAR